MNDARRTAPAALSALSDEALMARAADGVRPAFDALVARHLTRMYGFAYRLLGDGALAEDAVQEACVNIWEKAATFDAGKARFSTWAYRVLRNRAIDLARKRRPTEAIDRAAELADAAADVAGRALEKDRARQVADALAALPERQRAALVLTYYEGLANKEAAAVMEVGVKGLESLLVRARAGLKAQLAAHKDELMEGDGR